MMQAGKHCWRLVAILFGFLLALWIPLPAQSPSPRPLPPDVTLDAEVEPSKVVVGDTFQYMIVLNGNAAVDQSKFPSFKDIKQLRLISGPNQMHETRYMDGRTTITTRFVFDVVATEVGTIAIPPAQVRINGIWYETNAVSVEATPAPQLSGDLEGILSARSNDSTVNRQLQNRYFGKAEIPERVYRGQAIPVQMYIYRDPGLVSFNQWELLQNAGGNDFVSPNVADPQMTANTLRWEKVKFGSQDFERALLFTQYVVPTKTGKLPLRPPSLRIYLPLQQRNPNTIDDFFNMMPRQRAIAAELPMRDVELNVEPVPDKPAEAILQVVGNATTEVNVDRETVPQRELLTVSIVLRGEGFFDLLTQPKPPTLPNFVTLDTRTKSTSNMIKGLLLSERTFEYVYQASEVGEVDVPSITFAVFNPRTGKQEIVKSESRKVRVTPSGSESFMIGGATVAADGGPAQAKKAEARVLGKDVAYIDSRPLTAAALNTGGAFYLKPWFWLVQLVPIILGASYGLIAVVRRNRRGESEAERVRRGQRLANEALRQAREKLARSPRDEYYATLANGIMGYTALLLGCSPQGLTAEEAAERLARRGYPSDIRNHLARALAHCDAIRFSPAPDTPQARESALKEAEALILQMTTNGAGT